MSKSTKIDNLIQVKQALADKYARLAVQTASKPKKRQFTHRATRYRRQVTQLQRSANS